MVQAQFRYEQFYMYNIFAIINGIWTSKGVKNLTKTFFSEFKGDIRKDFNCFIFVGHNTILFILYVFHSHKISKRTDKST